MLDTLRRITQELNDASNLDEGLAVVVRGVKEHLAADVCSVYLVDAAGSNVVLVATDGLDPRAVGEVRFGKREGLVGLVVDGHQGRVFIEPSAAVLDEFDRLIRQERALADDLEALHEATCAGVGGGGHRRGRPGRGPSATECGIRASRLGGRCARRDHGEPSMMGFPPVGTARQGKAKRVGAILYRRVGEADRLRFASGPSGRFSIETNTDHTLEEVGKQFNVTRERIRQIEAKALRKLRHPSRSERLRSFLDQDK